MPACGHVSSTASCGAHSGGKRNPDNTITTLAACAVQLYVLTGVIAGADWHAVIIYLTGRERKYEEPTRAFLIKHNLPNGMLLMRNNNDSRKDYVIKEEIYESSIKPYYNVKFVLDDRLSVIRNCWNKLGLFVFKVGREYDF